MNLSAQIIGAFFFFQPLFYLVRRRLAEAREQICDDYVIQFTGRRADYAQCLVDLLSQPEHQPKLALALGQPRLRLMNRVKTILDDARPLNIHLSRKAGIIIGGCALVLLPLVSIAQLMPRRTISLPFGAVESAMVENAQQPSPPRGSFIVEGTVRFADTDRPAAGAVVWAIYRDHPTDVKSTYGPVATNADGKYRLEGLPGFADKVQSSIFAAYKGYENGMVHVKLSPDLIVQDFDLRPPFAFEGQISAPEQVDLIYVKAEVMNLSNRGQRDANFQGTATIAPDGRYQFVLTNTKGAPKKANVYPAQESEGVVFESSTLGESVDWQIQLSAHGFEPATFENVRLVRGKVKSDISVVFEKRTTTVSGRVMDDDGNSIPNLFLSLSEVEVGEHIGQPAWPPLEAMTDTAGKFHFNNVPSGSHSVHFSWERPRHRERAYRMISVRIGPFVSFPRSFIEGAAFMVQPETELEDVEITVVRRIRIRGRVLYTDGTPVVNTDLRVLYEREDFDGTGHGSGSRGTRTNEEGYCEFFDDDPGIYTITVEYEGLRARSEPIHAEEQAQIDGIDLILGGGQLALHFPWKFDGGGREIKLPEDTASRLPINGNFDLDLEGWTKWGESDQGNKQRICSVIYDQEKESNVVEFKRTEHVTKNVSVGIAQDVYIDLSAHDELYLQVDVKSMNQASPGTGRGEGEYPVCVEIAFIDQNDTPHRWQHGFYYTGRHRYPNSTKVDQNQWITFISPNLKRMVPLCGHEENVTDLERRLDVEMHPYAPDLEPKIITRVLLFGGGWDFTGRADNLHFKTSLEE